MDGQRPAPSPLPPLRTSPRICVDSLQTQSDGLTPDSCEWVGPWVRRLMYVGKVVRWLMYVGKYHIRVSIIRLMMSF